MVDLDMDKNQLYKKQCQPYVCTLEKADIDKAKEELHEDPNERAGAIEALRSWLKNQPHLKTRLDDFTLLAILRGAKFSQLRARELAEGAVIMISSTPQWFRNIDTQEEKLLRVIKRGYAIPLPKRDKNGSQIILYRVASIDSSTKSMAVREEIRAGMVLGAFIAFSELTQINGSVFIFDFTGFTAKHMTRWKLEDVRKWSKLWQRNVPGRFKAFHYYNAGSFIDGLMAIVKPFFTKKFSQRIHTHSNIESLSRYVPLELMPVEYLPDDYDGPHQGQVQDLIDDFVSNVTAKDVRDLILYSTSETFGFDASKKPTNPEPASFKKLHVE